MLTMLIIHLYFDLKIINEIVSQNQRLVYICVHKLVSKLPNLPTYSVRTHGLILLGATTLLIIDSLGIDIMY